MPLLEPACECEAEDEAITWGVVMLKRLGVLRERR